MAFSMSSRFPEFNECSGVPSPTKYNIPSLFEESASGSGRAKPHHSLLTHKCDDSCMLNICKHSKDFMKGHLNSKRHSLEPKLASSGQKAGNSLLDKVTKRRLSMGGENKENSLNLSKKIGSNIPRFRKNTTEGQAPSFMSRSQNIHSCFTSEADEPPLIGNFQRHSLERKSVKPIRRKAEDAFIMPEDQSETNLKKSRAFNVSYTVLPKIDENKSRDVNVTDDVKHNNSKTNENLDVSASKVLQKDKELIKELSSHVRGKKYYEIAFKQEQSGAADEEQPKSREIFALNDCNVIFLVNEEFIDDDYDSYVTATNGSLQVLPNNELFEITKYLVRVYLQNAERADNAGGAKIERNMRKRIGKLLRKSKKSRGVPTEAVLKEIEAEVRAAIRELKGQFRREIYEKTDEKLDELVSELKRVALKADEDVGDLCESATTNLISRLENIAFKKLGSLPCL